jgi:branched-subunit amino acid aminotransferase/4-amino-4-deoxychorismate lyase
VLVWLNGRVVAARDARVSALDRGLLHGDGAYDTWRTYGGVPFGVAAHVGRLAATARRLGLASPGAPAAWTRRTRLVVARNGLADAGVRLTITRGPAGDALLPVPRARPTVLLTARALPADLALRQERGIAAVTLPFGRDAAGAWAGMKLLGHASSVAGRIAAARRRADEALFVAPSGHVTEATSANVFLVERGALVTPPRNGILAGVTRALVIALARRAGLAVREEPIPLARLRRAREAFVTATTVEIVPLVRIDGRAVGGGVPGDATRALQDAYRAHVRAALARARR